MKQLGAIVMSDRLSPADRKHEMTAANVLSLL
jgi:hypothetical protein